MVVAVEEFMDFQQHLDQKEVELVELVVAELEHQDH